MAHHDVHGGGGVGAGRDHVAEVAHVLDVGVWAAVGGLRRGGGHRLNVGQRGGGEGKGKRDESKALL